MLPDLRSRDARNTYVPRLIFSWGRGGGQSPSPHGLAVRDGLLAQPEPRHRGAHAGAVAALPAAPGPKVDLVLPVLAAALLSR